MRFLLIAENRKTNRLGDAPTQEKNSINLNISLLEGLPVPPPIPMTEMNNINMWKKIKMIFISKYF